MFDSGFTGTQSSSFTSPALYSAYIISAEGSTCIIGELNSNCETIVTCQNQLYTTTSDYSSAKLRQLNSFGGNFPLYLHFKIHSYFYMNVYSCVSKEFQGFFFLYKTTKYSF